MRKMPRVAIVVPTADATAQRAAQAIAQARATTARRPGSTPMDVSLHVIESSGPDFRFSRSINRGIAAAPDADAWVLLNDDCFMDAGWLEAMLDTVARHPEVGVVGAVLRFPSGRLQHAGGRLMPPLQYFAYSLRKVAPVWGLRALWASLLRGAPYFGHHTRLSPENRLDFVTGACMLVTRACHDRIGGYDEGFEFSFEDVDYCLRALAAGFEVALATEACGLHLERATGKKLTKPVRRSMRFFHARWTRERVREVTRRGGRHGIQHSRDALSSCGCASVPKASAAAPRQPSRRKASK